MFNIRITSLDSLFTIIFCFLSKSVGTSLIPLNSEIVKNSIERVQEEPQSQNIAY